MIQATSIRRTHLGWPDTLTSTLVEYLFINSFKIIRLIDIEYCSSNTSSLFLASETSADVHISDGGLTADDSGSLRYLVKISVAFSLPA